MIANCRLAAFVTVAAMASGVALSPAGLAQHLHDDQEVAAGDEIGTVDFRVSCADQVVADFDRALGLMHHMMYEQARGTFEAIAEADPDCGMAYWGVATTLFQPLWGTTPGEEDIERGRRAIQKALEHTDSERERLLMEATAAFFEPETERLWERLPGWIDGMAAAYEAHPDDLDVAVLYGLSRLTLAQRDDRRHALHDEAETILRGVWEREPTHPGAIHYSIHATDADGRAGNALEMVKAYGEVAPNVPHALHMPSHIYVRLGDWPSVIDWNTRSAAAALDHQVNGAISFHYIHAIDYLVYGYLQRGEDDKAASTFNTAMGKDRHQGSFPGAFHVAAIPARVALEQRDWEAAAAIEPRTPEYMPWDDAQWPEGLSWFARGMGAVHSGDMEVARAAEQRLGELREAARDAADERFVTYIEVDRLILDGWIAYHQGEPETAVERMRSAAELEKTVEKHPVTPGALLPPNEALGDLLMKLDRPDEALAAYRASDEMWPERYNTLLGAARAADAAGDQAAARKHYGELLEIAGDSRRAGIAEARQFVKG